MSTTLSPPACLLRIVNPHEEDVFDDYIWSLDCMQSILSITFESSNRDRKASRVSSIDITSLSTISKRPLV